MFLGEVVNVSNVGCEYDEKLFQVWLDGSTNWTHEQLLDHGCSYAKFKKFQKTIDYFRTVLYFSGGVAGIFSAVLALLTFSIQRQEFAAISFSYHRAINAIELPYMILMIEHAIRDFKSPSFLNSYVWATFFAKVSGKIDNALPTSVNVITIFIAVERAIACLAPKKFPIINRSVIVWLVVFGSLCIAILMWAPSCFAHTIMYDNRSEPARHMPVWTEFGKGSGYKTYELVRHVMTLVGAALVVLATVSAVIGLQRTAARSLKRKISTRNIVSGTTGPLASQQNEYWLLLKNLSYLQLCETVPLIFLHIFLVATESIYWDYKGGGAMAPLDTSYTEATRLFRLARARQHAAICLDISNVAAHCFHFYWYLIFCQKVRQGFVSFLQYSRTCLVSGKTERRRTNSFRRSATYGNATARRNGPFETPLLDRASLPNARAPVKNTRNDDRTV